MTKEELHEIIKENNGDQIYFSFASEDELNYLLGLYIDLSEIKGFTTVLQSELVLDVKYKKLYDWGRVTDDYYILNNRKIYHLDFSTREEENIELYVTINEYIGKLSIPFEALQELKKGAKLKLL